jgi:hypothetical protein
VLTVRVCHLNIVIANHSLLSRSGQGDDPAGETVPQEMTRPGAVVASRASWSSSIASVISSSG